MKEVLERIARVEGWGFDYGRRDFHNLDLEEKTFTLFLDPVEEQIFFEGNVVRNRIYKGRCMLLMCSEYDRVYDGQVGNAITEGRYERYIRRCKEEVMKIPKSFCYDYEIQQWRMVEVINLYDDNYDGVLVEFQITTVL